ncbi:hypothetical protein SAMN02745945_01276 [Peptoclostridium litorale DSM 5388]|uniref:Uncharacterized protein n=1 Tax=Peptoclostridium litorale DSM 5388 TaxID=1121324 RepID=A0A069RDJ0_PEPLI|nr:hypothetical protein CLIT_13c01550 [Peptoclostridium litorale DSM 5388]SIN93681.1 hypothetical protein SAMN02745945_01276 [Peptoclostridium litorale DSM 5388]
MSSNSKLYAINLFLANLKVFAEYEYSVWFLFNKFRLYLELVSVDIKRIPLEQVNVQGVFGDTLIKIYKIKYGVGV